MSDQIIDPVEYETKGGIPRKAIVGAVGAVLLLVFSVYYVTSDAGPVLSADQAARAELSKPENVLSQPRGNPARVDQLADEEAERQKLKPPLPTLDVGKVAGAEPQSSVAPLPTLNGTTPPLPIPGVATSMQPPTRGRLEKEYRDPAAATRELDARDSAGAIFDESDERRASTSPTVGGGVATGLESKLQELSKQAMQLSSSNEAPGPDPILSAMRTAIAPAKSSANAFVEQMASVQPHQALYPSPRAADLVLNQGKAIPAVLTRQINSDTPGTVTAQVSMNVYDSRTQRHLVIPMGAQFVGVYNNQISFGQERMQFAFTRLIMPDGSSYDLPGASASDLAGAGGVPGDVNRHLLRTFGSSIFLGVLADRLTKPNALPNGGAMSQSGGLSATGQVFVDTARAELERNKNIAPTIEIPVGTRINVEVVRDIVFPNSSSGREGS